MRTTLRLNFATNRRTDGAGGVLDCQQSHQRLEAGPAATRVAGRFPVTAEFVVV